MNVKDRTALVTGATSGIGAEIARVLAAAGARVVVAGRDEGRGKEVVDEITSAGGRAVFAPHDLEDPAPPHALVRAAEKAFGPVEILVNNAGTYVVGSLDGIDAEAFDRAFRINVRGAFLLTQLVVPGMADRNYGRVIATSSGLGQKGMPGTGLYGATKAALDQLVRTWTVEYAAQGVTFNSIAAGFMETPLSSGALANPDVRAHAESVIPAHRIGRPADVAHAVLLLAADEAGYIQGNAVRVDGGILVA